MRSTREDSVTVRKSVISVRGDYLTDPNLQNFTIRHANRQKFTISPFRPPENRIGPPNFSPDNLDISDLKREQPEMFKAMGLDDDQNLERFRNELGNFASQLKTCLRNPWIVAESLKPLNDQLGERLQWRAEDYKGADTLVVGNNSVMLPNYANVRPLQQKKNKMLNTVLQEREALHDINLDYVPVFDKFILPQEANSIVAAGHLFGENENRQNFMLHGTYSHRLQWECVRQCIEAGHLQVPTAISALSSDRGTQTYSHAHLIAAIVYVKLKSQEVSLWSKTFDSFDDMCRNIDRKNDQVSDFRADLAEVGMSCLAPNQMMSTIKCFGDTLGLKNLQKYLNDSSAKRLRKFESIDRSPAMLPMKRSFRGHDGAVFTRLGILLNTGRSLEINDLPFTLPLPGKEDTLFPELDSQKVANAQAFVDSQLTKYSSDISPSEQATTRVAGQRGRDEESIQ